MEGGAEGRFQEESGGAGGRAPAAAGAGVEGEGGGEEREKCPQDNMERVGQLEEELKVEIAQMKKGKLEVKAGG